MKMLGCGIAMSLGALVGAASAQQTLIVDGTEFPLSTLMENCQSIVNDPVAQVACFNNITQLIEEQSGAKAASGPSVPEALDALRTAAEYQDADSGLSIAGTDCQIQIVYFNNYFHLSRRNISTIDLFSAEFDASKLQIDQVTDVRGAPAPLAKGVLADGATAATRGGVALDSSQNNFESKSPRTTIDVYANEVVDQLPANENGTFDFVLVHPQKQQSSDEIWGAFETFVKACGP